MSNEQSSKKVVYRAIYVGDDVNYWDTLQARFRTVVKASLVFKRYFPKENERIQSLIRDIIRRPTHIIYIDFTKSTDDAFQLARMLNRNNLTKKIVTVGLLDHQATEFDIKKAILAGVQFAHIKCSEIHDVVYDPMALVDPTVLAEPKYALAQTSDNITISELARINSVSLDRMLLEYNRPIVQGSEFALQTDFLNVRMPSSTVKVEQVIETNFYYNFNHKFMLSYAYMDDDHFDVADDAPSKEEQIGDVRRKYYKWIEDNLDRSKSKPNKVLIICKDFDLFNESMKGLDKYPFVVRHQPFITKPEKEIKASLPNIIAFQMEKSRKEIQEEIAKREAEEQARIEAEAIAKADIEEKEAKISEKIARDLESDDQEVVKKAEEEKIEQEERIAERQKKEAEEKSRREQAEMEKLKAQMEDEGNQWVNPLFEQYQNDVEALNNIVQIAKTVPDYNPIVIVFKCLQYDSGKLQQVFKYPRIMAHQTDLSFELIINMASALQKKSQTREPDVDKVTVAGKEVPNHVVYFNKLNPHSIAEIDFPIVLLSVREHELTFSSAAPIAKNTVFKCKLPNPTDEDPDDEMVFFITVVPHTDETMGVGGNESYRGLVHGIGEMGKKNLRKFINSVFFREKELQKQAELEEFKRKNQEAEQKKKGKKSA